MGAVGRTALLQGLLEVIMKGSVRLVLPSQQHQQPFDVVRQGGDALGHRPDPVQPQAVDRHVAQHRQDLNAVGFPVAVGVFPQRDIADPVPGVFNAPAVPHQSYQCFSTGPQAGDVIA